MGFKALVFNSLVILILFGGPPGYGEEGADSAVSTPLKPVETDSPESTPAAPPGGSASAEGPVSPTDDGSPGEKAPGATDSLPIDIVWPTPPPSTEPSDKGPETAYQLLLRMSQSEEVGTRQSAAEGLAVTGGAKALDALLNNLADPSPQVREAALSALVKAPGETVFKRVMEILHRGTPQQVANLDPAFPRLRGLLEERMRAVLLSTDEPETRKTAAAFALGRMRSTGSAALLEELAWSGEARLSLFSATALASLQDPSTAEALAGLLNHQDANVRWNAVVGLGRLGGPIAVKALSELVTSQKDERSRIRQEAVAILGQIGGPSIVPVLIESMQRDVNVSRQAGAALRRLTGAELRDEPTSWAMWYQEWQRAQAAAQQAPPLLPSSSEPADGTPPAEDGERSAPP